MPHVGTTRPASDRTIERLLFAAAFLTFAYFHQGGGWNQNARFALVRAIVEERRFAIDSFLVYTAEGPDARHLARAPVRDGMATVGGRRYALGWLDAAGRPVPLGAPAPGGDGAVPIAASELACTGDLAFHGGHFHPAKAPGGSFLAVPAYASVLAIERLAGIDPDDRWVLTVNAWLTSALSVGLVAAIGCVAAFRLALALSGGRILPSLLAALALAFGTLYLPYATALYEHDVVAAALLLSFYLLHRATPAREAAGASSAGPRARDLALAGGFAGFAAISTPVAALAGIPLLGYAVLRARERLRWAWFVAGGLVPLLALGAYNLACFSAPLTTNYRFQDPQFTDAGAGLGVLGWPRWDVLLAVTLSPYRGLFFGAPVLLAGVYGLAAWARGTRLRVEAWTMIAIVVAFLLFTVSFNGWHGGWAAGPRYLVPAVPFLALATVVGFVRRPRLTAALAAGSSAIALLATSVDVQPPVGTAPQATIPGVPAWRHDPISDWAWPLFAHGRAWPIITAQRDNVLRYYDDSMRARGEPDGRRALAVAELRERIDRDVLAGRPAPLLLRVGEGDQVGAQLTELSTIAGPVSVNPVGFFEAGPYRLEPPGSEGARWNSFNVGELLWPGSRWSLAPLLAVAGPLVALAIRRAARRDREASEADPGAPARRDHGADLA